MAKEIAEEYASSLSDLTVNSKPLINMLTILAEENIDHAGVIVETVEKHLEKVPADIKLPLLYLVDSIIKNVGGAYTQKFAQSIVSMFTRTFKQVDEKIRSQMFKLRETWHDVFPATKLYQLDVKVNLIDPAWPIQAQPQQSNIHVNPNFLKKQQPPPPVANVSQLSEEDEKMRAMLAKKEQELLMLQRRKIEMELEQTKRQLELAEKSVKKPNIPGVPSAPMPIAMVNPVISSVPPDVPVVPIPVKQRLGPPVNKPSSRIAPVSAALASARRDPRLQRSQAPPRPPASAPPPPVIAPNVFDIKPLDRNNKRHNVLTIDVQPAPAPAPASAPARRRDPRLDRPRRPRDQPRKDIERPKAAIKKPNPPPPPEIQPDYIEKLLSSDPKKISKLPPIPKINREERTEASSPAKKRKEARVDKKKKREDAGSGKDSSSGSSPEKKSIKLKKDKAAEKEKKDKPKDRRVNVEENSTETPEPIAFKELKNYHKERYMRRNRETSESPEKIVEKDSEVPPPVADLSSAPEILVENKDVDLRVLPAVVETKPAAVAQKRSSTEAVEVKTKKSKHDKFDILFGSEDVDLRQLPQVEELSAPPAPVITESPKSSKSAIKVEEEPEKDSSPPPSPKNKKKDWNEVKEKSESVKKTPTKLDLVRAKLAEATKGKDRLGRPLLFTKSPSIEKERRRTISSNGTEDIDMRNENGEEFDAEDHKKTISIIMSQAKEQFNDGQLDKNQYNTLMYQVLQLNEKLKLKEAKQRESLEISKRKLKAQIEEDKKVISPRSSPNSAEPNNFGDIDERVNPAPFMDTPPDSQGFLKDSDMRVNGMLMENGEPPTKAPLPMPPMMPMFMGPFNPTWMGQPRGRTDDFGPRRFRAPVPPFFRGKFDNRGPHPGFDPILPLPLPTPQLGICQGPCPLVPYERCVSPPPLGVPGTNIPPTDFRILEYIDHDPVKTIQIDGVPREIRFYGETAVIMLDWDDPREIKFLPGCRRVTFDNKDSVVISFNEGYKQVEIDDQVFDIRFGAPTRELYINGRWHECFFGGPPFGVIIDGKPRLVHLEGPLPQVDIGKDKRTDLVAGKINLIVNATQMCPVYLDAKVQKFSINDKLFTIRFADCLRTVLINEQPFAVKYGDLPEPIYVGNEKYFIRFSALPRNVKPGHVQIANMEGSCIPPKPVIPFENIHMQAMDVDQDLEPLPRPLKTPSPDGESRGLDMLASLMPSNISSTPSASEYSLAEPLFSKTDKIPGLDSSMEETSPTKPQNPVLPILGNVNVTDLFAKLVASGIVAMPPNKEVKEEIKSDKKDVKSEATEIPEDKKEDKSIIHPVDLLKPETLRVKQPGLVAKLYGGMQCSGCGTRFPPEQTVRYSAHLDWHFRQNRRERDSARRAHSRHWHYDLPDWIQYEELELDAREKNWFETGAAEEAEIAEVPEETPSVAAGAPQDEFCALCGDKFDQFYNEDKEEWHLRNSTRFEDKNYHPACLEDYKASQVKEQQVDAPQQMDGEIISLDKTEIEEPIEINEEDKIDSDNESVVEVLEPEENLPEPVEIDEGDEDDVVLKAEPIEEVVVDDDNDTDDETTQVRAERDRAFEVDLSRVKKEPVEADDEPIITAEEEQSAQPPLEITQTTILSSIDGNVQMDAAPAPSLSLPPGGIRINISKAIPTVVSNDNSESDKMYDDISADDEPLPPGEEPELDFKIKPTLEGVHLRRQPPVQKGSELSGLCSIM